MMKLKSKTYVKWPSKKIFPTFKKAKNNCTFIKQKDQKGKFQGSYTKIVNDK